MSHKKPSRRFAADNRAVSAVIGFILIFGILVLLLTVYQAQIVPQQNAQTEFEHFEDNKNEMIELRNAISTAGQADVSQFPSVTLGTSYQTRLLTINPAPPVGTVQTSEPYNITIANETHQTNVSSRFLVYEPGYNELQIGSTTYEHSVLYLDERNRGNNVSIVEDQNLVKNGKVRITALQNSFQQQGTNRITLELYPQDDLSDGDGDFPEGDDLNVTIPTQLSDDEYWDDELENEDVYDGVDIDAKGEDFHALNLSVDDDDLEINTVGIQLEPDEEPAKNTEPQTREGGEGGEGGEGENTITADSIEDLTEDESGQTQTFEFTLDEDASLGNGDEVEIDVINVNNEGVNYGDADITASNNNNPEIRDDGDTLVFEAQGNTDGQQSLTVTNLDVPDETSQTFDIQFTRLDNDDSSTESFEIVED